MIWYLLLFLVFPFFTFILCLRDLRKPVNAIIFIAFYALYGYCVNFELTSADISRIGYSFQTTYYINDPFDVYQEGGKADLYSGLLFYNLLPITHNPKVLCCVVALIFGILSYALYVNVYRWWPRERKGWFYVYILVVLSNISLVHLTGVRYYTGGLLFLLSAVNFIKGKRLWIIGTLLPGFIHFSLIIATGAFIIYFFIGRFARIKKISIPVLAISLAISFFNFGSVAQEAFEESEIENSALEGKINAYTEEKDTDGIQREQSAYREANSIFTNTFNMISRVGLFLFLVILINKIDYRKLKPLAIKLLNFTIVLSAVSFLSISLTGTAMRFVNLAWCVFLLAFPLIFKANNLNFKSWTKGLAFVNFYSIAFLLINAPRLVSPELWYMNLPNLIMSGLDFRITWFVY